MVRPTTGTLYDTANVFECHVNLEVVQRWFECREKTG